MVAIFTGAGTGLDRSSGNVLGARGLIGTASTGQAGEQLLINAANGNLVVTQRDEFLIGRGPDSTINRTYNAQGQSADDNGDNWANYYSQVVAHVGTIYTAGAYLDRIGWDGGRIRYYYDTTQSGYVSKEGAGAHDLITYTADSWHWQDGDSGIKETYGAVLDNRVVSRTDRDGNAISYSYTSATGNVSRITTADGNYTDFTWSGNNLTELRTTYTDTQTGTTKTLTRTRYSYDGYNRLSRVTVDLSPGDNSIADGRVYETVYSYVGTSKLVASITQTDGTKLDFTYDSSDRVTSFIQWVDVSTSRTTTLSYGSGVTTITDPQGNVTSLYYDAGQLIRQVTGSAPQNLLRQSEALGSTAWSTAGAVIANDATHLAPDGMASAEKWAAAANVSIQQFLSVADTGGAAGGNYVADIWVYSETAQTVTWAVYDNIAGHRLTDTTLVAGQWTRLRQTATFAANSTDRRVQLWSGSATTLWLAQAQLRQATAPNVYVKTEATVVAGGEGGQVTDFYYTGTGDLYYTSQYTSVAAFNSGSPLTRDWYRYDANGNVSDRYRWLDGGYEVTRYSYGSKNEVLTETTFTTLDPDGHGGNDPTGAMTTRYVYDAENHLRFAISPEGRVKEYLYDGSLQTSATTVNGTGQLTRTIDYNNVAYTMPGQPTEAQMMTWRSTANMPDKTNILRTDYAYDFRGNLSLETRYKSVNTNVGDRIDVTVSSIGDARSLAGGTLLMTPLLGPDQRTYALAQGALLVGGFQFEANQNMQQRNHPTTARLQGGATVETAVDANIMSATGELAFLLAEPDFGTAQNIADRIDGRFGPGTAFVRNADEIRIRFSGQPNEMPRFVAGIEALTVTPSHVGRIVINERTGTVVAGGDIMLSPVVISQGDIRVSVETRNDASQPSFIAGLANDVSSLIVTNTRLEVDQGNADAVVRFGSTTIADLILGLNRLNVNTRRMISILEAMKSAGALHAEIIVQ